MAAVRLQAPCHCRRPVRLEGCSSSSARLCDFVQLSKESKARLGVMSHLSRPVEIRGQSMELHESKRTGKLAYG